MTTETQTTAGKPILCHCGKLLAYRRDGKLFVFCKKCKREIEVADTEPEPRARAVSKE